MKVKLFLKYNPLNNEFRNLSDLETEINDWLAASPGIRILHVQQSAEVGAEDRIMWAMSFLYEEARPAGQPGGGAG
jgi:hypothetical protein